MRRSRATSLFVAATAALGCSSGAPQCTTSALSEPLLAVNNAVTGAPICDATITLVGDGGSGAESSPTLVVADGGAGCQYQVSLGAGNYVFAVTAPGFASGTATVEVTGTVCIERAIQQVVQVPLQPG